MIQIRYKGQDTKMNAASLVPMVDGDYAKLLCPIDCMIKPAILRLLADRIMANVRGNQTNAVLRGDCFIVSLE